MKYHSDNTNNKNNTDIIINLNYGMNEIDAEASVEWPSWCYAGNNFNRTVSFHFCSNFFNIN